MTLIDSSVWIEHFNKPNAEVLELLSTDRALVHPMVLGELSLSPFRGENFQKAMIRLSLAERVEDVEADEVLALVERFKLWGRGIGWVDCNLLASARAAHCHLLTRDKALKAAWLQVRPQDW